MLLQKRLRGLCFFYKEGISAVVLNFFTTYRGFSFVGFPRLFNCCYGHDYFDFLSAKLPNYLRLANNAL